MKRIRAAVSIQAQSRGSISVAGALLVVCGLLPGRFRNTLLAAESPARFLTVKTWQGNFHHSVSSTYSQTFAGCTTEYNVAQSLSASGVILSNAFKLDDVWYWQNDAEMIPVQGGINDHTEHACPTPESTVIHLAEVAGGFSVAIDTNAN